MPLRGYRFAESDPTQVAVATPASSEASSEGSASASWPPQEVVLGLGAEPGSLEDRFGEELESAVQRAAEMRSVLRHIDLRSKPAKQLAKEASRRLGMAEAGMHQIRKQLAHPERHPPPRWGYGQAVAALTMAGTAFTIEVCGLLLAFTSVDIQQVPANLRAQELFESLDGTSCLIGDQLQEFLSWLRQLRALFGRASAAVDTVRSGRESFKFASVDPDGSVSALALAALARSTGRAEKWISTAERAARAPHEFVADPRTGGPSRALALTFLTLDELLDYAEQITEDTALRAGMDARHLFDR